MCETLALTFFWFMCSRTHARAGFYASGFQRKESLYQTYLSRIENGQANPTLNAMEVITVGLGLTVFGCATRLSASQKVVR